MGVWLKPKLHHLRYMTNVQSFVKSLCIPFIVTCKMFQCDEQHQPDLVIHTFPRHLWLELVFNCEHRGSFEFLWKQMEAVPAKTETRFHFELDGSVRPVLLSLLSARPNLGRKTNLLGWKTVENMKLWGLWLAKLIFFGFCLIELKIEQFGWQVIQQVEVFFWSLYKFLTFAKTFTISLGQNQTRLLSECKLQIVSWVSFWFETRDFLIFRNLTWSICKFPNEEVFQCTMKMDVLGWDMSAILAMELGFAHSSEHFVRKITLRYLFESG